MTCHQDKILALQCNQVGQGIICQKSAYCYMSRFLCNRYQRKEDLKKKFKQFQGQSDVTLLK